MKFKPGTLPGLALIAILCAGQSLAQHPVTMWEVQGENNRIYLLGSIHLLRSSDYPLPTPIYDAYTDAETLIMELDMDDMDQGAMQAVVMELGINADGETLARGSELGVDARSALADNDSHSFFDREGGILRTGPTGTNVMDLAFLYVDP